MNVKVSKLTFLILLIIMVFTPTSTAHASDGVAQLQIVTRYPIQSIQIIGTNQDGNTVNNTWYFSNRETHFTTWDWWWRISYRYEWFPNQYPAEPSPYVWVTYIDGHRDNKQCSNPDIGELSQVSSCYFSYAGPGATPTPTDGDGGDDGSGPDDSGGNGATPTPTPLVIIPGQITSVSIASQIFLGERPLMEFGVYNPNPVDITITDANIDVSTDIPSQFNPMESLILFEDVVISPYSTNVFEKAPDNLFYRWIDDSHPAIKMCSQVTTEEFIKDFAEAWIWAIAGEKVPENVSDFATTQAGVEALFQLELFLWGYPAAEDVINGSKSLTQLDTGEMGNYLLPEGKFYFTPIIDDGVQGATETVFVRVPQKYQSNFANGMNALNLIVPTMLSANIIANIGDPFLGSAYMWIGPMLAYTDGIAMGISCYPISLAYATPIQGAIVLPGAPSSQNNAPVPARGHLSLVQPGLRHPLHQQHRAALTALQNLSHTLAEHGIALGNSPSEGDLKRFSRDVTPLLKTTISELNQLKNMIEADGAALYEGLETELDNAITLFTNMQTVIDTQDIELMHCLAVLSPNLPIYGEGEIHGTEDNDIIIGSVHEDVIYGDGGNDCILGGNGTDTIYGGAGNDILYGDNGDDIIYGEAGNDWLDGGNGPDTLDGGSGTDIGINKDVPDQAIHIEIFPLD